MKAIKFGIVLALFLGYTDAIAIKTSSIDNTWIPEEDTMLMLKKSEYMDFEMKWLAPPKEDPNAPTEAD